MKSYVKPVVLENDEIFEGVYAASGALDSGEPSVPDGGEPSEPGGDNPEGLVGVEGDCWTVIVEPEGRTDLDGRYFKNFRIKATHSTSVTHISTSTTVVITFSSSIEDVIWEHGDASCTVNGSTVTIVRTQHANGYYSGDQYDCVLKVRAADDLLTESLTADATISGIKTPNVQGGWD